MQKQDLLIENSLIDAKSYYKKRYLPTVEFGAEGELSEIKDKGVGPERVSMKIDLDIGRQELNKYKIKKNDLEIAELQKKKTWFSLEEEVIGSYFDYLAVKKNISYLEKTIKVLEGHQRKLNKMLNGGNLIPKNELLKIEIDMEENKLQYLSEKYKEKVLKQKLFTLMGLGLDQDIEFKEFNMEKMVADKNVEPLEKIEENKIKGTIDSRINNLEMENAIYDNKIAKAELLPKFYIKPEYLYEDTGYDKKGGRVLVGFNWNFEWGNTLNDIKVSNNNIKISEMDYKDNKSKQILKIRGKYEELKMAKLSLEVANKRIELMRENLKLDTSRFENRLMGSNDYLKSVNSLKEAEEKLYNQKQELLLLYIELQNLIS